MEKINLPRITEEEIDANHSKFVIEPLYPGYGATIGNTLRRVLLSSITGAAATSVKIDGISHEFSSIVHAKEDVIEVMMNLKGVYFKSFSDEPVVLELSKKGPAEVKAGDFKKNSNIEIANPDAHIITLDKGADFNMEVTVEKDRGFRSVNIGTGERSEIGSIGIDALFSPVERVKMSVEDTRVGQMTNYDKLILEVITNGTIEPSAAIKEASQVLIEHYTAIMTGEVESQEEVIENSEETESVSNDAEVESGEVDNKTKIEDLNFGARTLNALSNAGIKTVGGLKKLSALKLEEIKGLGKKGIDEINAILG
ncbi:MAG: DNA-directed RNA polymerase subunit alpha [Candidatus Berkelbacteria bacterium]|nr:DNA-directed RNA polymerase subunit alpha [Candidatus Berkelbacteria bacterium]